MRQIQIIKDHMSDTLHEINEYYRDYVIYKDIEPTYAKVALDLANTHLAIYDKLHNSVVDMINKYKATGKEIPPSMMEKWNYMHQRLVEEYEEIKFKVKNPS